MKLLLSSTLAVLATLVILSEISLGASATGRVTMTVVSSLAIQNLSDLSFSMATPGAGPQILMSTDSSSGHFKIQGEPNTAVTITLPNEIYLKTGNGGQNQVIKVLDFESSVGASSHLSVDGDLMVSVGATRAALSPQQQEGQYEGSYTVEVIY